MEKGSAMMAMGHRASGTNGAARWLAKMDATVGHHAPQAVMDVLCIPGARITPDL